MYERFRIHQQKEECAYVRKPLSTSRQIEKGDQTFSLVMHKLRATLPYFVIRMCFIIAAGCCAYRGVPETITWGL